MISIIMMKFEVQCEVHSDWSVFIDHLLILMCCVVALGERIFSSFRRKRHCSSEHGISFRGTWLLQMITYRWLVSTSVNYWIWVGNVWMVKTALIVYWVQ